MRAGVMRRGGESVNIQPIDAGYYATQYFLITTIVALVVSMLGTVLGEK